MLWRSKSVDLVPMGVAADEPEWLRYGRALLAGVSEREDGETRFERKGPRREGRARMWASSSVSTPYQHPDIAKTSDIAESPPR